MDIRLPVETGLAGQPPDTRNGAVGQESRETRPREPNIMTGN